MKLADKILKSRKDLSDRIRLWQLTIDKHPALFERLEALGVEPTLNCEYGSISVNFDGDAALLRQVWREIRVAGWKPDDQPKPNATSFFTYWRQEGVAPIFMGFTSTVCQRVQVGVKMVEQPIYEVKCGDQLSELGELL